MITYILISVVIAFWFWYPALYEKDLPEEDQTGMVEWIVLFIITTILWPYLVVEYIIQLFKQ